MRARISTALPLIPVLLAFFGLLLFPAAASEAARSGLSLCGGVIIPSLFPFMVLGNLLSALGLPYRLAKLSAPLMQKLFGVSGMGSAAFFLGLVGGYPLGAVTVANMYSEGALQKTEAERLLGFCDNSGPAFIIGVAGGAIFQSAAVGFFLYGVHILAAVLSGILLRSKSRAPLAAPAPIIVRSFSEAFTESVKRAALTCITVCGFVVFFGVLIGIWDKIGSLPQLMGELSRHFGFELHFSRALLTGFLEIGTGISALSGLAPTRGSLALCAFILGWGGLSVQAQAAAVMQEGGLSSAWHLMGKMLHGVLSALITLLTYSLFF
ncbi:MAG: sporulation protein [Oscillospiraceae bacterium]